MNIVSQSVDIEEAIESINHHIPDLVFISLPTNPKKIFDFLEFSLPLDFEIIFISPNHKSSYNAIKYNPIDYLITPLKQMEIKIAIKTAIKKISDKYVNQQLELLLSNIKSAKNINLQKIAVPTLEGFIFIEMDNIVRCEANGAYTILYTTN